MQNIGKYTKIMNQPSIQESSLFREGLNHFIYIPSFHLRVYLVLAESKIEKEFSPQLDLYCSF